MSGSVIDDIPIIDADTHVVEPPDLWTSRVSSKWGDLVPHVEWDEDKEEEAWYTGSAAPRRGRRSGDGRLARAPAVPPASIQRHRPEVVERHRAGRADGHLRRAVAGPLSQRRRVRRQEHRQHGRHRPPAGLHPGLQRLPRRLQQRSARPLHPRDRAAVLGSRRDAGRDRALRGERPQGHRLHPGPVLLRSARS